MPAIILCAIRQAALWAALCAARSGALSLEVLLMGAAGRGGALPLVQLPEVLGEASKGLHSMTALFHIVCVVGGHNRGGR
jgi:hypothetical protein